MVDPVLAQNAIVKHLTEDVPYNATVVVETEEWSAPKTSDWLSY